MMSKHLESLKKIHGKQYVEKFVVNQSKYRIERLLRYITLQKGQVVVDFACGNGMLLEFVASQVKQYIGVDFSESFIKYANENKDILGVENAFFICSSIADFCRQNIDSFDVGFVFDFSEHVDDCMWLDTLKNIRKSLKNNGKLYLHTPNAEFFVEIMKENNFLLKQFPEHIAIRTMEENIEILKISGLKIIKTRFLPHYNYLQYLHPLSYLPVVGKCFNARIFIEAANCF